MPDGGYGGKGPRAPAFFVFASAPLQYGHVDVRLATGIELDDHAGTAQVRPMPAAPAGPAAPIIEGQKITVSHAEHV